MARKRTPSRDCELCGKVLYGFDDDVDLWAVAAPAEHPVSAFAGKAMCGGCFETWELREPYGLYRIEYVLANLDATTRAVVHRDSKCLLLVDVAVQILSYDPIKLLRQHDHTVILWLGATGTDILVPLEAWGRSMPSQSREKRLRNCEQQALEEVWDNLMQRFGDAQALLAGVDLDGVLQRHQAWLARNREKQS